MPTLKGTDATLSYVQCFLYLVSSINVYFSYYMTGYLPDRPRITHGFLFPSRTLLNSLPELIFIIYFSQGSTHSCYSTHPPPFFFYLQSMMYCVFEGDDYSEHSLQKRVNFPMTFCFLLGYCRNSGVGSSAIITDSFSTSCGYC